MVKFHPKRIPKPCAPEAILERSICAQMRSANIFLRSADIFLRSGATYSRRGQLGLLFAIFKLYPWKSRGIRTVRQRTESGVNALYSKSERVGFLFWDAPHYLPGRLFSPVYGAFWVAVLGPSFTAGTQGIRILKSPVHGAFPRKARR